MIAYAGKKAGIPVTLCGELASMPLEAMVLIGLGYRSLSMSPASIGPVKAMLLELQANAVEKHLHHLLANANGAATLRPAIKAFARDHGVPV